MASILHLQRTRRQHLRCRREVRGIRRRRNGFEMAKLYVAKTIGREDLIVRHTPGKTGQKQDVKTLLDPPAVKRDDRLPSAYLGCRLGIEPGCVLMPSTPFAGWASLPYIEVLHYNDAPVFR